jgi:hypothetical protein
VVEKLKSVGEFTISYSFKTTTQVVKPLFLHTLMPHEHDRQAFHAYKAWFCCIWYDMGKYMIIHIECLYSP